MFFYIPRCYRSTPLRTYPGLTANIHWRFAPRKEGKGTAGAVVFFTYPPHFEEALAGKSIPLFGSAAHSLAKDSLGLSFSPSKRGRGGLARLGVFRHAPPVAWLPGMVGGQDGGFLPFEGIAGVDASLLVEDNGDGVAFVYLLLSPLVRLFFVGGGVGFDHLGGEDT